MASSRPSSSFEPGAAGLAPKQQTRPAYPSGPAIDRILAIPDKPARNLAITQGYFEISRAFAQVVGTEDANWTTYAVWASKQAGEVIRMEALPKALSAALTASSELGKSLDEIRGKLGPFGALIPQPSILFGVSERTKTAVSDAIAQGNRDVFEEISRAFTGFIETFGKGGADDPAKVAAYLGGFPREQAGLRDGMAAYAAAMNEQDPAKKSELMFKANALVGLHEQTFLQRHIERAMNAPAEMLVGETLERLIKSTLPGKVLARFGLLDDLIAPALSAARQISHRVITEQMMTLSVPNRTFRLGDDLVGPDAGPFPDALKTLEDPELRRIIGKLDRSPDSLEGSAATNWVRLGDRMNFIVDLFRAYQREPSMFQAPFPA